MATRTSSPPGSRSRSTSSSRSKKAKRGGSSTRNRSTKRNNSKRRPAPRAVRNGTGPVARIFGALFRGVAALWLGIAHGVGSAARRIGHTARELDPEHRRDGVGLFLCGLAIVIAAAVWFEAPGTVLEFVRTVVAGSVGKVGWLVPLLVVLVGWRVMRDPVRNGPAGRQVIGWSAFCFGVLGLVHIANGSPEPVGGDTTPLREGGGAVGFVVSSLLLDLLRSDMIVVPLLVLLAFFGVLVITATPLYRVPERLAAARDRALGRHRVEAEAPGLDDTQPIRRRRRNDSDLD